jgi:hypothetical protein
MLTGLHLELSPSIRPNVRNGSNSALWDYPGYFRLAAVSGTPAVAAGRLSCANNRYSRTRKQSINTLAEAQTEQTSPTVADRRVPRRRHEAVAVAGFFEMAEAGERKRGMPGA